MTSPKETNSAPAVETFHQFTTVVRVEISSPLDTFDVYLISSTGNSVESKITKWLNGDAVLSGFFVREIVAGVTVLKNAVTFGKNVGLNSRVLRGPVFKDIRSDLLVIEV